LLTQDKKDIYKTVRQIIINQADEMGDINASDFFDQNKLWKEYNVSEKIMAQHLTKFLEPGSLLKFTEM